MKQITIVCTLVLSLFCFNLMAQPTPTSQTPLNRELNQRLNAIEKQRIARFTYNVAVHGGTATAHGLGVYLPAKAVIERSYLRIDTQFTDSGTGTVALSCEDANNIKTATDITGSAAGAYIEGASTGAASAFVASIAARCEITATVATATQDAGKLTGWVRYVIHD